MSAKIGYGLTFAIGDGESPEVFTNVAELIEFGGLSMSRDSVETTHYGSEDQYREFIGGLKDAGEVSLTINYVEAVSTALKAAFDADDVANFKITLRDGLNVTFAAVPTSYEQGSPLEDKMTESLTLKVSGKPTWAAAA